MTKRKTLRDTDLIAISDTREQTPLDLSPLRVERLGLKTGDYSLKGAEHLVCVERKSLNDFVGCCTKERERFERELDRMCEFKYRAIVIESSWSSIEAKFYHGLATPNAVLGSALGFAMSANVSVLMADNHARAGKMVARMLWIAASRIHRKGEANIIFREPGDEDEQGMGVSA